MIRNAWPIVVLAGLLVGVALSMPCVVGCGTRRAAPRGALPAGAVEQVFEVEGMTCGGCAAAIRTAVTKLDGVVRAQVDHEQGRAAVTYDPGAVTPDAIVAAIERLGYQVVSRHAPHPVRAGASPPR